MSPEQISNFLLLFAVIDPIGSIPLFLSVTRHFSQAQKSITALKAVLYSGLILGVFLLIGQQVLSAIGIRLGAFQIAGGLVLFLFGVQMILKPEQEEFGGGYESGHDVAVFPLAIPSLANPGALTAIIILTDHRQHSYSEQLFTGVQVLVILIITWILFRLAHYIYKVLGVNGTNVLVRIIGLLITALSVEICIEGLATLGWLPLPPE